MQTKKWQDVERDKRRYGYPPHLFQRPSHLWGHHWAGGGVESIKGAETFELELLFLMKLSWEFSSWIEPRGFCRARDIRVGLRREEIDLWKPDLGPRFKDEKVLQGFCKPRGQVSRIKIEPRLHSPNSVSVAACTQLDGFFEIIQSTVWNSVTPGYGNLKLSSSLSRPMRKVLLMYFPLSEHGQWGSPVAPWADRLQKLPSPMGRGGVKWKWPEGHLFHTLEEGATKPRLWRPRFPEFSHLQSPFRKVTSKPGLSGSFFPRLQMWYHNYRAHPCAWCHGAWGLSWLWGP